jgi:hypothetical protein
MSTVTLDAYVRKYMRGIPGYLSRLDAELIAQLLHWQLVQKVEGDLCEIGVHHGRLFFLLALSRRAGEVALAIDLFEDDAVNTGVHAGRPQALSRNARKLQVDLSEREILKCSSHEVSVGDILSRASQGIRFFSIDGGHSYGDVENDLELARQCLCEKGIIAVDDFCSALFPEVSFATYDFLRKQSDIIPVLITSSKLYLVRRGNEERVLTEALQTLPSDARFHRQSPLSFMSNSVAYVVQMNLARIREKLWNLMPA